MAAGQGSPHANGDDLSESSDGIELTELINNATSPTAFNGGPTELKPASPEEDWEDYIPEPPDGGYGWVIMIASFFNNFILDGIAYCFGVYLLEYSKYYNASIATTSLSNSLLCGVYLLVGPIVGALVNKFGCRPVGFAGSIIGACAFILSTFATSIGLFQFTYGVIGGIGFGLMYLPAVVGVGYYFEKKRALATGIAVCGTGIGTFCLAPLSKILLQHFDWKSAHILIAGLVLQGCICSALMRPLEAKRRRTVVTDNGAAGITPEDDQTVLMSGGSPSSAVVKDPHQVRHRNRTISSTSFIAGSRLIVGETSSPADNLHASAFLNSKVATSSQMSTHDLSRPLYRKDIFYSGSVLNVSHTKSGVSLKSYIASIATIPSIQEKQTRLRCLNSLPKPMADILAEMLDLSILRNKGMIVLAVANIVGMLGFFVPIIFSSSRAKELGVSDSNAALLLSIIGITNTVGRVLSGSLSLIPSVSPLLINNICLILCGITVFLTPFSTTFDLMAITSGAYGLLSSTFISLTPIIMCELIGLEKLTNGYGLLCLVRGVTSIAGPPLEGMLYDWTGDYDATFYAGGSFLILSGALHCLLHLRYFKGAADA